jgi:hypothetical protein
MEDSIEMIQFGISLKQLRELMDYRGAEGVTKLEESGGVKELCKKLHTSPNEGKLNYIMYLIILCSCLQLHVYIESISIKVKKKKNQFVL